MNYSYIMGVDNVDSLDRAKFDIEEIDGDYGVSFEDVDTMLSDNSFYARTYFKE